MPPDREQRENKNDLSVDLNFFFPIDARNSLYRIPTVKWHPQPFGNPFFFPFFACIMLCERDRGYRFTRKVEDGHLTLLENRSYMTFYKYVWYNIKDSRILENQKNTVSPFVQLKPIIYVRAPIPTKQEDQCFADKSDCSGKRIITFTKHTFQRKTISNEAKGFISMLG